MTCGGIRVAVSLPAAAAGEVAALIFDKAHHIGERITKKHADFMGKIGFAAQPPGQLPQHTVTIGSIFRQGIALALQELPHRLIGQHLTQAALAVNINEIPVGLSTALKDPDLQPLLPQLVIPAVHPGSQVGTVPGLIAEQPGGFQSCQHRRALFDHHGLKITLHGCFPSAFIHLRNSVPRCTAFYAGAAVRYF